MKIYKTMLMKTKRKQWNLTEREQGKLQYFGQLKHSYQFKHCEIRSYKLSMRIKLQNKSSVN